MTDRYTVVIEQGVLKGLRKMNGSVRRLILSYIRSRLEGTTNPRALGRSIGGDKSGLWRYRVGDYRVLARIDDAQVIIYAFRIGHRRDLCRD
ncbi:MAG: type II toxin-antitoxin system RelE/ParE family toxin [Bifidobacteriaceae bacterium]|jgi:mRNA interferase RelE/StbE|nr:type II toxin-antitoxin system RelE/ParE family toxin [Bifidobacteriaceae bacterium]